MIPDPHDDRDDLPLLDVHEVPAFVPSPGELESWLVLGAPPVLPETEPEG